MPLQYLYEVILVHSDQALKSATPKVNQLYACIKQDDSIKYAIQAPYGIDLIVTGNITTEFISNDLAFKNHSLREETNKKEALESILNNMPSLQNLLYHRGHIAIKNRSPIRQLSKLLERIRQLSQREKQTDKKDIAHEIDLFLETQKETNTTKVFDDQKKRIFKQALELEKKITNTPKKKPTQEEKTMITSTMTDQTATSEELAKEPAETNIANNSARVDLPETLVNSTPPSHPLSSIPINKARKDETPEKVAKQTNRKKQKKTRQKEREDALDAVADLFNESNNTHLTASTIEPGANTPDVDKEFYIILQALKELQKAIPQIPKKKEGFFSRFRHRDTTRATHDPVERLIHIFELSKRNRKLTTEPTLSEAIQTIEKLRDQIENGPTLPFLKNSSGCLIYKLEELAAGDLKKYANRYIYILEKNELSYVDDVGNKKPIKTNDSFAAWFKTIEDTNKETLIIDNKIRLTSAQFDELIKNSNTESTVLDSYGALENKDAPPRDIRNTLRAECAEAIANLKARANRMESFQAEYTTQPYDNNDDAGYRKSLNKFMEGIAPNQEAVSRSTIQGDKSISTEAVNLSQYRIGQITGGPIQGTVVAEGLDKYSRPRSELMKIPDTLNPEKMLAKICGSGIEPNTVKAIFNKAKETAKFHHKDISVNDLFSAILEQKIDQEQARTICYQYRAMHQEAMYRTYGKETFPSPNIIRMAIQQVEGFRQIDPKQHITITGQGVSQSYVEAMLLYCKSQNYSVSNASNYQIDEKSINNRIKNFSKILENNDDFSYLKIKDVKQMNVNVEKALSVAQDVPGPGRR